MPTDSGALPPNGMKPPAAGTVGCWNAWRPSAAAAYAERWAEVGKGVGLVLEGEFADLESIGSETEATGSDNARRRIHARIRDKARANGPRFVDWVNSLDPHDMLQASHLADIYEALAPDATALEVFFSRELDRLLSACEAQPVSTSHGRRHEHEETGRGRPRKRRGDQCPGMARPRVHPPRGRAHSADNHPNVRRNCVSPVLVGRERR